MRWKRIKPGISNLCQGLLLLLAAPAWGNSPLEYEVERLVFSRLRPNQWNRPAYETLLIDEDDLEWTLTNLCSVHMQPRLSPDRTRLLFTSTVGGTAGLWIIDHELAETSRLCDGEEGAWSPDGRTVVFQRDGHIHEIDVESGVEKTLLSPARRLRWPDTAPCGDRILFVEESEEESILRVASRAEQQASPPLARGEIHSPPRWSPDGAQIVFQDGEALYVTDLNGDREQVSFAGGVASHPCWSQDGNGLAYAIAPRPGGPWKLVVADRHGEQAPRTIRESAYPGFDMIWTLPEIAPSPPRSRLAVTGNDRRRLARVENVSLSVTARRNEDWTGARLRDRHIAFPVSAGPFLLEGQINAVLIPDRLGDDMLLDPRSGPGVYDVSHAPLAIVLLGDGNGIGVVAAPGAERRMRINVQDDERGLSLAVAGPDVRIGLWAGPALWSADPSAWTPPFPAVWRYAYRGHDGRRAEMAAGPGNGDEDTPAWDAVLDDIQNGMAVSSHYAVPFDRMADTPTETLVVTDLVRSMFGLDGAGKITGENDVMRYAIAAEQTSYPTVAHTLMGIRYAFRNSWNEYIADDLARWSRDTVLLFEALDARRDVYADFAERLGRWAAHADGDRFAALHENLISLLSEYDATTPLDAIRDRMTLSASPDAARSRIETQVVKPGLEDAEKREKLLGQMRSRVREARNGASTLAAEAPDAEPRAFWTALFTQGGAVLAERHLSEPDDRGEPVKVPRVFTLPPEEMWRNPLPHRFVCEPYSRLRREFKTPTDN